MIYENLYQKSFYFYNSDKSIEYIAMKPKRHAHFDVTILMNNKEVSSAVISDLKTLISFTKQAKRAFNLKTVGV